MKKKTAKILKSPEVIDALADLTIKTMKDKEVEEHHKKFRDFTEKWEKKFLVKIRKYLGERENQVLNKLNNIKRKYWIEQKDESVFFGWSFPNKEWNRMLQEIGSDFFTTLYDVYGKEIFKELEYAVGESLSASFDVTPKYLKEKIEELALQFAENLNDNMIEKLRGVLSEGMMEGESMVDIASRIKDIYGSLSEYDAERIARTEVIRISNSAADEAYKQSGVVDYKEWSTAVDERVCPFCSLMNGRIIEVGKNFFKKGESVVAKDGEGEEIYLDLDYEAVKHPPLHPMCRCCLLPVVNEEYL